jgi:protein-tyrosine phosphatase
MRAELYMVPGPWPGRLAILPRPRGGDWLADEIESWRRASINVVVSLLTPDEAADLGLTDEPTASRAGGIEFMSFPIPDRGVPDSTAAAVNLFAALGDSLAHGKTVAVHCRQGIGRSALVAAGLLTRSGVDAETAIRCVAAARGLPVPETDEQREWIAAFARATGDRLPA